MRYRYDINRGIQKLKTKTSLTISAITLGATGLGMAVAIPLVTHADSSPNINFESPTYHTGVIDGQNGWSATGSAGHGCALYDEGVTSSLGTPGFGAQSFRISNAVTSGCFGDQAFAPSLTQPAGEADALNINGNPVASPQSHFEAQFDIASTTKANQGMAMSVSPDRGDGARMSYLRFEDHSNGIQVFFDDVTDPTHGTNLDTFNESQVATLSYTSPHTIKFVMDFKNGPDNDVVNIFIDGNLVKTGTSWEDYYRFDTESNLGLAQNDSRTVSTLLFREGGTAVPANSGNGYLIDNLTYSSSATPGLPTSKDQCMNNGWMSYGATFKNQGDCVSFIASKGKNQPTNPPSTPSATHSATGTVNLSGPPQTLSLNTYDNGLSANDTGFVTYSNPGAGLTYTVPPTCVNVVGNTAYIAYQIPLTAPVAPGVWVVWKVVDGGVNNDSAGFTTAADMASANALCENASAVVTNYPITSGDLVVQ